MKITLICNFLLICLTLPSVAENEEPCIECNCFIITLVNNLVRRREVESDLSIPLYLILAMSILLPPYTCVYLYLHYICFAFSFKKPQPKTQNETCF